MLRIFTLGHAAVALAAMALLMLFAAFMQLYLLNSYPPGLDPDAAAYGLNVLKPFSYGFLPFYDYNNGSAEPVFIYSASLSILVFGPTRFALKLVSAFFGITSLAVLYACLCELGRGEFKTETRRIGISSYLTPSHNTASRPSGQAFQVPLPANPHPTIGLESETTFTQNF